MSLTQNKLCSCYSEHYPVAASRGIDHLEVSEQEDGDDDEDEAFREEEDEQAQD